MDYNLKNNLGLIDMNNTTIQNSTFGEVFKNEKNTQLFFQNKNNKIYLSSKEYRLEYILSDGNWLLQLNSLDKISKTQNF